MIVCKNCGVELEKDMPACPLCGLQVGDNVPVRPAAASQPHIFLPGPVMSAPEKKFTWEIISLVLLAASVTTFVVDYLINKTISWSQVPAAMSLTIFFYVSLFAFWQKKTIVQMAGGLVLSSISLVILDALTGGIYWAYELGIPLLFITNLVVSGYLIILRMSKDKGINLLAYGFLGAALLCVGIESILSLYNIGVIKVAWSLVVTACSVPVILVLLFVHFRMKKGRSLEKTFHI